MPPVQSFRLQLSVFALVSASFANIYITQPVLPVLRREFATDLVTVSLTVSAVILGIALSNLPFGMMADRRPIHPIIFVGGLAVAFGGLICAATHHLWILIGARFVQGLFIPALTTCLAAYLAKSLPAERLNVVMGAYVSATVLGGLGGRLLGGWLHAWLDWRAAFVAAAVLTLMATMAALGGMPKLSANGQTSGRSAGFISLLRRWPLLRLFLCAAGSFAVFSSVFNYLPFRLSDPPFGFSTHQTTMIYLVYIVGIFIGPVAGRLGSRFGSGVALVSGAVVLGAALAIVSIPSVVAVLFGLIGICAGFFTIHAAAVGALNRKLYSDHGRANALYVLFYYAGGWMGITAGGLLYRKLEWPGVVYFGLALLLVPIAAGWMESKQSEKEGKHSHESGKTL